MGDGPGYDYAETQRESAETAARKVRANVLRTLGNLMQTTGFAPRERRTRLDDMVKQRLDEAYELLDLMVGRDR